MTKEEAVRGIENLSSKDNLAIRKALLTSKRRRRLENMIKNMLNEKINE
jgi:hypothetical protein